MPSFRGRHRLPGEDSFVAFETAGFQQPQVGRHHIAQRQLHHITWDQLGDVDAHCAAITERDSLVADLGMQRRNGTLRAVLVVRLTITGMMMPSVFSATKNDTAAAATSSSNNGFSN